MLVRRGRLCTWIPHQPQKLNSNFSRWHDARQKDRKSIQHVRQSIISYAWCIVYYMMYMIYKVESCNSSGATWMIALLVVRDTALRAACTWLWPATDADANADADADAPNDANTATASITRSLDPSDTEDADTSSILSSPCVPHMCICRSHPPQALLLFIPVPILKRGEFLAGLVFHSLPPSSIPLSPPLLLHLLRRLSCKHLYKLAGYHLLICARVYVQMHRTNGLF